MKLTFFIALLVLLAIVSAKKFKAPRAQEAITPQWTCPRLKEVNVKAGLAKADVTKCQYVWYIYQELVNQYTTPQYPVCFAQLDGKCDDKIVDWKEKRNIRIFSQSLEVQCEAGAQWDEVKTAIEKMQATEKYADAFNTDYWTCVLATIDPWIEAQYVPFPHFPAPFLDIYNYVCQGIESQLKNAERQALQDWFDTNTGFTTLTTTGQQIYSDMEDLWRSSGLQDDLVDCFSDESRYFGASVMPEVYGAYSTNQMQGQGYAQAYLNMPQQDEISQTWNAQMYGYECWNYYAPKKHYHESKDNVSENGWDGNRGHPLCAQETLYLPLTMFGPLCCPIKKIQLGPGFTFNCCMSSSRLSQNWYGRAMGHWEDCFGCTCLQGYTMNVNGDYWGMGPRGACEKDDGEASTQ